MSERVVLKGPLPARLGNQVSEAIMAAVKSGMEIDEAVCVVVGVAADYGRTAYGTGYLAQLAEVVRQRRQ